MKNDNVFEDLNSGIAPKVIGTMVNNEIAFYSQTFSGEKSGPLGAVIYVVGKEETEAIKKAFKRIEKKFLDQYGEESEGLNEKKIT